MNYREIERGEQRVFLIDMRREDSFLFSELVQQGVQKMLRAGKRVCMIVNKKGFSSGMICHRCGYIPQCEQCDISIAQHVGVSGDPFGLCHMCHRQYTLSHKCHECDEESMRPYGYGVDRIAQDCRSLFGVDALVLTSKQLQSTKKIEKTISALQQTQLIIATGLLEMPPTDIPIDMLVVVNADIGLSVPDYTAQWQAFSFLSRLFDNYLQTPVVLVQSHDPEQQPVICAARGDSETMRTYDLAYREKYAYPPYCELARILYKHDIEESVFSRVNKLYQEMRYIQQAGPYGEIDLIPTPPLVYKAFGKYRYNIIIKGKKIRDYLDSVVTQTKLLSRGFKIDWEPGRIV